MKTLNPSATCAWPVTCESSSGGLASWPSAVVHSHSVDPAAAPSGTGILPMITVPSWAVHLACAPRSPYHPPLGASGFSTRAGTLERGGPLRGLGPGRPSPDHEPDAERDEGRGRQEHDDEECQRGRLQPATEPARRRVAVGAPPARICQTGWRRCPVAPRAHDPHLIRAMNDIRFRRATPSAAGRVHPYLPPGTLAPTHQPLQEAFC